MESSKDFAPDADDDFFVHFSRSLLDWSAMDRRRHRNERLEFIKKIHDLEEKLENEQKRWNEEAEEAEEYKNQRDKEAEEAEEYKNQRDKEAEEYKNQRDKELADFMAAKEREKNDLLHKILDLFADK
jgi:hypothetical protein